MVAGVLQAVKRLAKAEITKDVERGEVKPGGHVHYLPTARLILRHDAMKPVNEESDILVQDRLLGPERTGREGRRESLADTGVGPRIDGAQQGVRFAGLSGPPGGIFEELLLLSAAGGRPWLEDVGPGIRCREGDLVRCDAQDRSILTVKVLEVMDNGAAQECLDERDA